VSCAFGEFVLTRVLNIAERVKREVINDARETIVKKAIFEENTVRHIMQMRNSREGGAAKIYYRDVKVKRLHL